MKVCPDEFYQLFTLHALLSSTIIPLAYALLINKSAKDYNNFLQKILEQDDFRPESIQTDFESGTIKSIKESLPNISHKGMMKYFLEIFSINYTLKKKILSRNPQKGSVDVKKLLDELKCRKKQ